MILFVSSLFAGLLLGGAFALIALGLVLAFRATRTFNFAHGELMLTAAFIVGWMQAHGQNTVLSIVIALLVSAIVGALFYILVLVRTTGLPLFMSIVATLGLATVLDGVFSIVFGGQQFNITLSVLPTESTRILGAHIGEGALILSGFAIVLPVGVALVIRFTHLGMIVRAAGQDPLLASQCGIGVRRVYLGSWALAALLAGIAGIVYGSSAVVNESMTSIALAALPAMVLGGIDSVIGAVIGGIVIGEVESFSQAYLGGAYVNVVAYVLLLIVLLIYPQGLFGTKEVIRA